MLRVVLSKVVYPHAHRPQAAQRVGGVGFRDPRDGDRDEHDVHHRSNGLRTARDPREVLPRSSITLVLDNARYQRCRLVQERATALDIKLTFLPSYSPHLNLIERIWGLLKKHCLNGQYYETFDLFQQAIHEGIAKLATDHKPNVKTLITRNFQHFNTSTIR
jgi:hypothetical protein